MASKTHYFSGEASWSFTKRTRENYNKDGQEWCISVDLDDESLAKFKESQLQNRPSKTTGAYTFKRPCQKLIKTDIVTFDPPVVLDKDNNEISEEIGDGSKIIVKVVSYDSRGGKGHRLEAIKVVELVPFAEKTDDVSFDF